MFFAFQHIVVFFTSKSSSVLKFRTIFQNTIQVYKVKSQQAFLEEKGLLLNLNDLNLSKEEKKKYQEKINEAKALHRKLYLKEKRQVYRKQQARIEIRLNKEGQGMNINY